MHTYPAYVPPSTAAVRDLVTQCPLAIIVTTDADGVPVATHAPVVLAPASTGEDLEGATLWGHIGAANPHWELWRQPYARALVIFSTSHAYVSPTVYGYDPAVPTMNYAAVHITGKVALLDGDEEKLRVVEHTVRHLESVREPAWDPTPSRDAFVAILPAIRALEIRVESVRSVFKLSQDLRAAAHGRVERELDSARSTHHDVASLMRTVGTNGMNHDY